MVPNDKHADALKATHDLLADLEAAELQLSQWPEEWQAIIDSYRNLLLEARERAAFQEAKCNAAYEAVAEQAARADIAEARAGRLESLLIELREEFASLAEVAAVKPIESKASAFVKLFKQINRVVPRANEATP